MSKPPVEPYPPDVDDDALGEIEFGDLVDLVDVVVRDVDWAGSKRVGLSLRRIELLRCRLTGAELAESALGDIVFDECRIDLVGLRHAKLERVVFRDCRMGESDFSGASLKDVLFERCELHEATFTAVRLLRVEVRGCNLRGLHGAEALRGARMPWGDVIDNAGLFAATLGIEVVD